LLSAGLLLPIAGGLSSCAFGFDLKTASSKPAQGYVAQDIYQVLVAESFASAGSFAQAAEGYRALYARFGQVEMVKRAFHLYVQAKDYPQASQMARAWIAQGIEPRQSIFLLRSMAQMAKLTGDYAALAQTLVQVESNFESPQALIGFVRSVLSGMDEAAAVTFLQVLIGETQQDEARAEWRLVVVDKAMDAEQWEVAREALTHLRDRHEDSRVRLSQARYAMHQQEWAAAQTWLEPLLSREGWQDLAALRMAEIEEAQQAWAPALAELERIAVQSPLYWEAQRKRVSLLIKSNQPAQALTELDALEQTFPKQAALILMAKGELQAALGHYQAALSSYQTFVDRFGANAEVYYEMGMAWVGLNRMDDFVAKMQDTLSLDASHVEALNALGYYWVDQQVDVSAGAALIERAKQLSQAYYILDSWGWALFRQGRYAEAIDYLQRAFQQQEDPEIAYHLAEAYLALGDKKQSAYYVQLIEKRFPEFVHPAWAGLVKKLK
jgi:tetratricopeptide (TPR) repeat protein